MPRLPSAYDSERPVGRPAPRQGAFRPVDPRIVADIGANVSQVGARMGQKQDQLDYASARSVFLRSKIETDHEFDQDQDWQTHEERYTEKMATAQKAAADRIGNRQARQLFMAESAVDLERGAAAIRKHARDKEVDFHTARTEEELQRNMDAALRAPDEATRIGLIDASNVLVNSMVGRGYWDETRAGRVRQNFVKTYQNQKDALVSQEIVNGLDSARNLVLTDPAAFTQKMAETNRKIDGSGISTEAREKLRTAAHKGLALSAVQGQIQADPNAALASLKDGTFDQYLDADNKASAINAASAEIKRRRAEGVAEARASIAIGLQDEIATIRATGRSAGLVTPEIAKAAYPDDPRKADAIVRQIDNEKKFFTVRQSVSLSSPEEDRATLAELQAAISGPGAAQATDNLTHYRAAISAKARALKDDPAAYVASASPYVGELLTAAASDPSRLRAYAEASLQMQERLGVPEQNRRILSEPQMEAIVARFGSQNAGGEDAATTMQGLAEQWGALWPRVYGEMVKSEKLPPMAAVVGSMPGGRGATALAEAIKVGIEPLRQTVGDDAKTVRDAVPGALADLRESMLALRTSGAHTMYQNYAKATEALALKYVAEGQSAGTAVRQAANDIALGRYEFRGTWRAPKERDVDRVSAGAAVAQANVPNLVDVPQVGLPKDDALAAYKRQIGARGYWVTAPDDAGLVLYDETGSAVTIQGKPWRLTWGDLEALAGVNLDAAKPPIERTKNRLIREEEAARRASELKPDLGPFDPEGGDYDYVTAKAAGMGPDGTGENAGHWGSVAEASEADKKKYGLPDESYILLKGRNHETWDKAVKGEEERGFKVVKKGNRYFSVPE